MIRPLARTCFQIACEIRASRLENRRETREQANDDGGAGREENRARVAETRGRLALVEQAGAERGAAPMCDDQAERAAQHSEEQAFGQQLREEPSAADPEREAERDLSAPLQRS